MLAEPMDRPGGRDRPGHVRTSAPLSPHHHDVAAAVACWAHPPPFHQRKSASPGAGARPQALRRPYFKSATVSQETLYPEYRFNNPHDTYLWRGHAPPMVCGQALSAEEPPQMTGGRKGSHDDNDPCERAKAQHGEAQTERGRLTSRL